LERRIEDDDRDLKAACAGVGVRVYGVLVAGGELEYVALLN